MTPETKEQIREMMDTEGWQIIEEFILERRDDHQNQLLHCDLTDVEKHRASHKAYNSVLQYVLDILNYEE